MLVAANLSYYRAEHIKMLNDIIIANHGLAANTLLLSYCSGVIASIYLATVLFFMDLVLIVKLNALLVLLAMIVIASGVISPMIYATKIVYSADKYHFAFVGYFGRDWAVQKIKQHNYYELIHTNKKLCFTVGHYFNVSSEAMFQVCSVHFKTF